MTFYKLITKDVALLSLTSILLLWALAPHRINYYLILRWIVSAVAIYQAYRYYKSYYFIPSAIFVLIAIIFNPILPLYFRSSTWHLIDVITAVIMLFPVFNYYYIRRRFRKIPSEIKRPVTEEEYLAAKKRVQEHPEEMKKVWKFLSELPGKAMACPYCERNIKTDDIFCPYCGKKLIPD